MREFKRVAMLATVVAVLVLAGCTDGNQYGKNTPTPEPSVSASVSAEPSPEPSETAQVRDYLHFSNTNNGGSITTQEGAPVTLSMPNSAGGVDVQMNIVNSYRKVLKYATYTVVPYNAVGDQVVSEIGGVSAQTLKFTGPLAPGVSTMGGWRNVWYNHSIDHLKITGVLVEYIDGESESFDMSTHTVTGPMRCLKLSGDCEPF